MLKHLWIVLGVMGMTGCSLRPTARLDVTSRNLQGTWTAVNDSQHTVFISPYGTFRYVLPTGAAATFEAIQYGRPIPENCEGDLRSVSDTEIRAFCLKTISYTINKLPQQNGKQLEMTLDNTQFARKID